jgi:lipoprotein-anchoring transpeptidase ErfK/SrfK
MSRVPRFATALVVGVALLSACTGGSDNRPSLAPKVGVTTSGPRVPPGPAPGTSQIAQANVPVLHVYAEPLDRASIQDFANPWFINDDQRYPIPLILLVESQRPDWTEVLLPIRPNGTSGWVRTSDVRLITVHYRVEVDLSEHHLTVYQDGRLFLEDTVAVGKPSTPTPVGRYFIRVLLRAPDPNTVYGPFAYGLSSHSDVLSEFNGGDGEIGIHGNNDASVLGQDVSSGCVRMDNAKITRLATTLPLGTPVDIVA